MNYEYNLDECLTFLNYFLNLPILNMFFGLPNLL
jgi:hypothetical protein